MDSAMWRYTHFDSYKKDQRGCSFYRVVWEDTIWLGAIPSDIHNMASEIYDGDDPTFPCDISFIKWHPSWMAAEDLLDDGDSLQFFWMNTTVIPRCYEHRYSDYVTGVQIDVRFSGHVTAMPAGSASVHTASSWRVASGK
jgi:hypothetical protein